MTLAEALRSLATRVADLVVPDWRDATRWWTVRIATALAALDVLAPFVPALERVLPERYASIFAAAIVVGRLLRQYSDRPP